MNIRKADIHDIESLIKLRLDFLTDEKGLSPLEEQEDISVKSRAYFQKWLANDGFIAFLAEDNGCICSTAFLSIVERPPRTAFSSYLVGTVYNVFTYPEYRRKGIATKIMSALLEEAQSMNIASVDLLATEDGRFLYEKFGFQVASYTAMRKKLV